ncbi:MAG TPA: flagellar basal body rod protein FlgB [Lachnospiraceae bacterium]|nr:flagellar basal body rod protein FlgB [Lachnospiraceae bacterium]
MISSDVFDYVNVLNKAADAAWLRNETIANNIANDDTPGYKRQDVNFEGALRQALEASRGESMDAKVHNIRRNALNVGTYVDHGKFSYRIDDNNVDPDTEFVELAGNQIRYQALIQAVNQEFANLKTATK